MPGTYNDGKARDLTKIVMKLGDAASFRNILREAARSNVLRENKTLRLYLNLLVAGGVLTVRSRDVGSVRLQQLYRVKSEKPKVMVGLAMLRRHGLNWDIPGIETRIVSTDFRGLARSKLLNSGLIASLEDCLTHELRMDARRRTGSIIFVAAILSTTRLDLPYLLWRADRLRVGRALRLLFNRILEVISSKQTETAASIFMPVRTQFLKIARQYAQSGFWKLVDEEGTGNLGVRIVKNLTEHDIVTAAGKQLGVTG